jgi:hypothetical protein
VTAQFVALKFEMKELIFCKVALEWDEEKFSGAALSELIH